MTLTVFATTILVICASLFALMALVPLMIEHRRKLDAPDNLVFLPRRGAGRTDTPAA